MNLIYVISNGLTFGFNLLIHGLHVGEVSNACQHAFVLKRERGACPERGLLFCRLCRPAAKGCCRLLKRRLLFLLALIVCSFLLFLAVSAWNCRGLESF